MTITKVSYGKTYALGNYCSERIDLEASIDETDDVGVVVSILKMNCDEINKKNNPGLYVERTDYVPDTHVGHIPQSPEPQPLEEKISPEQEIENTLKEIENATAETLHTFQLQAAKNQSTMGAYNRRKKQLNIQ